MANITTAKHAFPTNQSEELSNQSWQTALKTAIRDPAELCQLLDLPLEIAANAQQSADYFGLFVPRAWLSRIESGNPHDPLLRQVLPIASEMESHNDDQFDPVDDRRRRRVFTTTVMVRNS